MNLVEPTGVVNAPHANPISSITNFPMLEFAFLTSTVAAHPPPTGQPVFSTVRFNTIHVNWYEFRTLFFSPGNNFFAINPANSDSQPLSFRQTYQEILKKDIPFSLTTSLLNTWATQNNVSINSVPVFKRIQLIKQAYLVTNLANVRGSVGGLALGECIDTLLRNGDIVYTGDESFATVDFVLIFKYEYEPLNTAIVTQFIYRTNIPGFANNSFNPPPYSNHNAIPRKLFDLKDDISEASEEKHDKSFHVENFMEKKIINANDYNDEHTIMSNDGTEVFNEVQQIIKGSAVSDDGMSSKW